MRIGWPTDSLFDSSEMTAISATLEENYLNTGSFSLQIADCSVYRT